MSDPIKWFLTFGGHPIDRITIAEDHPDIGLIKDRLDLVGISLIDLDKFCLIDDDHGLSSILYNTELAPCKLARIFRRVEHNLSTGESRRIPVVSTIPTDEQKGPTVYYFVVGHNCFVTTESTFHPPWGTDD